MSGIGRTAAYSFRSRDADFAAQWESALKHATAVLEATAFERAINGTVRPVFFQGQEVGEYYRYSDRLMLALLRARMPEKYGPMRTMTEHDLQLPESDSEFTKRIQEQFARLIQEDKDIPEPEVPGAPDCSSPDCSSIDDAYADLVPGHQAEGEN